MLIFNGCTKTSVKIVKIDSFCTGKYEPQTELEKKDFDNIGKIRKTEIYRITIDKFINNLTINEKEFKQCQNLANHQLQN
jgi:hypothetical protein